LETPYYASLDDPLGFFRFTQVEGFVSDNWRVNSNLSIEAGLPPVGAADPFAAEQPGELRPGAFDPAQAVRVNPNGTPYQIPAIASTGSCARGRRA
jgi:hypothetical protein